MTRHTRNRQRIKALWMETGINMSCDMQDKNLPISRIRLAYEGREIDPTFKWVRTKRHNFIYDEVNGITEYLVDKNVISWTKIKPSGVFRSNMNPKGSSVMTYRIGHTTV